MSYLGLCPHLQPSPGGVSRGAWPWHLSCHSLSAQGTWMLLCPSGPSYHVPMSWTPIKAAALMGLVVLPKPVSFPVISLQMSLFSQTFSSVIGMRSHAGDICLCQQVQGLWSCCSDVATRLGFLSSPPVYLQLGNCSVLQYPSPCQTRPPLAISALVMPAPTSAPFPLLTP